MLQACLRNIAANTVSPGGKRRYRLKAMPEIEQVENKVYNDGYLLEWMRFFIPTLVVIILTTFNSIMEAFYVFQQQTRIKVVHILFPNNLKYV